MKRLFFKKAALVVSVLFFACGVAGCKREKDSYTADQKYLYGMDYILFEGLGNGIDYVKGVQLLNNLGVKSLRHWMHVDWFMDEEFNLKEENVETMRAMLAELKKYDFQIIGMNHNNFNYTGMTSAKPPRDTEEGSYYREWLALYEESWYRLASLFPEITIWEIDNETNNVDFMPSTEGGDFSLSTMTDISTDMFYYGSKGVHRANPDATTVMGGFVTWNGEAFLEGVYENIKSGDFGEGSTDPDDYFQALAWHPYTNGFNADRFVEDNRALYNIALRYEKKHKTVYFTELGNWTATQSEETAAEYLTQGYKVTAERLPFVESIHYYRMFDNVIDNNNVSGIFYDPNPDRVDMTPDGRANPGAPKAAAYAYQRMTGRTGSLELLMTDLSTLGEKR